MYRSGQRVVTQAIQKYLGSSYDVVKKVYDNLTLLLGLQNLADNADKVVDVADNLEDVTSVADNLTDVSAVADNIVVVTEVNAKVDDFNTKYLGSYASAPTVDGNGDPLVEGATYWDTTLNAMFVYTGSQWVKPTGTGIVDVDTFTGDGSTASFPLDVSPASKTNTSVFIDGVYQEKDTYSVSTNLITFNTAPNGEASIEVIVNEITNFITGTQTETHTLTSGQTVVSLTNSPAFASFHIQGEDVDSQRLDLGTDYTLDLLTNTITLTNSYPENTVLKMLYGYDDDISVELAPLNQAILGHVNDTENAHPASSIDLESGDTVQEYVNKKADIEALAGRAVFATIADAIAGDSLDGVISVSTLAYMAAQYEAGNKIPISTVVHNTTSNAGGWNKEGFVVTKVYADTNSIDYATGGSDYGYAYEMTNGSYVVVLEAASTVNPYMFGAMGDYDPVSKTGTVDKGACVSMLSYTVENIDLLGGHYLLNDTPVSADTIHFDIQNKDRISIYGYGTFYSDTDTNTTALNTVFKFTDCNNVDVAAWAVGNTVDTTNSRGLKLYHIHNQTKNTSDYTLKGGGQNLLHMLVSSTSDASAYRCRDINVDLNGDTIYYGVNLINNGDILRGKVVTNAAIRSYFVYGVHDHIIDVHSSNHVKFTDILIKSYEIHTTNIKVKYTLRNSASADAVCTVEHQSNTQDKIIKNIEFDVDIMEHDSTYQFTISQFNAAGSLIPTTSSIITNIRYKGVIQGRSLNSQNFNITTTPNSPSILIVEPSLNTIFENTKGFTVLLGTKLIRSKSGDLNGVFGIPVGFYKGRGWGGTLKVFAMENSATLTEKTTSRIYNLLGATVNPEPALIVASEVVSNVTSPTPLSMTMNLDTTSNSEGLPQVGVVISGHTGSGQMYLELDMVGSPIVLDVWG